MINNQYNSQFNHNMHQHSQQNQFIPYQPVNNNFIANNNFMAYNNNNEQNISKNESSLEFEE